MSLYIVFILLSSFNSIPRWSLKVSDNLVDAHTIFKIAYKEKINYIKVYVWYKYIGIVYLVHCHRRFRVYKKMCMTQVPSKILKVEMLITIIIVHYYHYILTIPTYYMAFFFKVLHLELGIKKSYNMMSTIFVLLRFVWFRVSAVLLIFSILAAIFVLILLFWITFIMI